MLPIIEEQLEVGKRQVDRGGYRITKVVGTRAETIDEPLARSQVTIERCAIDRLLASNEIPAVRQEDNTTIYPVIREVLVTEKRLLLVEEVRVTRHDSIFRQPQTVILREEKILVERMSDGSLPPVK